MVTEENIIIGNNVLWTECVPQNSCVEAPTPPPTVMIFGGGPFGR